MRAAVGRPQHEPVAPDNPPDVDGVEADPVPHHSCAAGARVLKLTLTPVSAPPHLPPSAYQQPHIFPLHGVSSLRLTTLEAASHFEENVDTEQNASTVHNEERPGGWARQMEADTGTLACSKGWREKLHEIQDAPPSVDLMMVSPSPTIHPSCAERSCKP